MPTALPPPPLRIARVALVLAVGALALSALAACDGAGTDPDGFSDDLVGRLQARDRYVPLADALALTGLDDDLRDGGPFTVLAPTRTAFAYVGTDFSPVLFAAPQREALARVLRHHVVRGRLTPDDFADGAVLTAIDGSTLTVRRLGPVATVNGVTVDLADPTSGTNGVAYPASDVLVDVLTTSERVRLSPLLSSFSSGLVSRGVQGGLDGLERATALAPINDAFTLLGGEGAALLSSANAEILARVLRASVLPGDVDLGALAGQTVTTLGGDVLPVTVENGVVRVAGLRVLHSETTANGRVYILGEPVLSVLSLDDRVRLRPDLSLYGADVAASPVARARLADRAEALTVFAPSDIAYSSRIAAVNAALLEPANAALRQRMTAVHVVRGRYTRADLVEGLSLTALDGTVLRVERLGGEILIGGRPIVGAPSVASNGLLYALDGFAFPDVDLFDTVLLRGYVGFTRAVRRADLELPFRTVVRTAFVVSDAAATQGFLDRPDLSLLLRRTATTEFIPALGALSLPHTFTALDGSERAIEPVDCDLRPGDSACSPFALASRPKGAGGAEVYQGGQTPDGSAAYHPLRSVDDPPSLRAGLR